MQRIYVLRVEVDDVLDGVSREVVERQLTVTGFEQILVARVPSNGNAHLFFEVDANNGVFRVRRLEVG